MSPREYPLYLAGTPHTPNHDLEVKDKWNQEIYAKVPLASETLIDEAIEHAVNAESAMKELAPFERRDILLHCVGRFSERFNELAEILCIEAGKPIGDSKGEVTRLIDTFRVAAEESVRIEGEMLELQISKRAKGYSGMTKRVPIGACSFIAPFNFPLNLAAHKIAPAIASGCPFILKPASLTPIGALLIGEVLAETNLPEGAFSILPCRRDEAKPFTEDPRLKLLSFTGSPDVGWQLKNKAGKKKVTLELGGNAACVIDEGTDITDAVKRLISGTFYQSGQSCISVQRVLIHKSLYAELKEHFVAETEKLVAGDPKNEETFIGPMISEDKAIRLETWIEEAVSAGGRVLCGGRRKGALLEPTLMENVAREQSLYCKEAFGPVAVLSSFEDFEQALHEVNDSVFGLQAGVFTKDIYRIQRAWDQLKVGGVVIGDVPSWRVDNMPYGGVKESGFGREGIRSAIEDMTETRLLVIRNPDKA